MRSVASSVSAPTELAVEIGFRDLLNDLRVGVLIYGPDACVILCNSAACDLFGLSEDQFLGRSSFDPEWDVLHEDGTPFPAEEQPAPKAIATRLPVADVAMGVYRPDRQDRVWLLVYAEPQVGLNGGVDQVICSFTDITERKQADELRKQIEERFTKAFHASPHGIAITRIADNQIIDINESYLQIVGYRRGEVVGRTAHELGFWVDEADRAKMVAQLLDQGFIRDCNLRFRRGSGEVGLGLASVELITVGDDACALTLLRDVTDQEVLDAARTREHLLYLASVRSLAATVDARDAYTHSHSQQVSFYCSLIAAALELPADEAETIELAGLLHDIGKIAIPDTILQKPGRLTPKEWEIMKTHAARGADILSAGRSPVLAAIVPMVRSHHERWGGGGYPDGLIGDGIPLGAAVIAVADTFDTITTARPYKAGDTLEVAYAELKRWAGSQFNPRVAEAFLRVLERDSAAGADYIQAIARGREPGISVLPRIATPPEFAALGPQSLSYQEQQRLGAHTRSLYAIGRGFDGVTDEQGVVEAAAALAREHLGAESLYLFELKDAEGSQIGPGAGRSSEAMQAVARWGWHTGKRFEPFVLRADGMITEHQGLFQAERPVAVSDMRAAAGPALRPMIEGLGCRSGVFVQLRAGGESVGGLGVCYQSLYHTFTKQDLELCDALGAEVARVLAGIGLERAAANLRRQIDAMENVNLALARLNRDLAVISEIAGHFAAMRDADALCGQVVEVLAANFGYSYVGIALVEGDLLNFRAWAGYGPVPDPSVIPITSGVVGRVVRTGAAALVPDVTADPDYREFGAAIRSEICVPLVGRDGVLGVINVESAGLGSLGEVDMQLLSTLAPQIAVALENIRLYSATHSNPGK